MKAEKYMRSVIEVFGRPPFLPLEEHAKKAEIASGKLTEAMEAYFAGDLESVDRLSEEINKIEQEADYIKQNIRAGLSSSVKIPVDPKLLLDFLSEQDLIVNGARNAAYWMKLREYGTSSASSSPPLSPEIKEGFLELVKKAGETVEVYHSLIERLYKLVTTSFSKTQLKAIFALVPEVDRLEHEVDVIESRLMKLIFREQDTLRGSGVRHLTELVELIGELADRAVSAADALQTMVIRR